jgi:hypothetical protein
MYENADFLDKINNMIHETRIQNAKRILTTKKYESLKIDNMTHKYSNNIINNIEKINLNMYKNLIDKQVDTMYKSLNMNNIIHTKDNMKSELYNIFDTKNDINHVKDTIKNVFKRNIMMLQDNINDEITDDMKIELKNELDKPIIIIKVLLFIFFISTVILNHDTKIGNGDISNNMGTFLIENFVVGIGSLLPMIYIYYLRHKEFPTKTMIEVFCIGVAVNVILQFGGFYTLAFKVPANDTIDRLINGYTISIVIIPFILIVLYFLIITFVINESDLDYGDDNYYIKFISEIILFTAGNTLPYLLIAYNRNSDLFNNINNTVKNNITFSIGLAALRFALLHIVLQLSGVYRYELGL